MGTNPLAAMGLDAKWGMYFLSVCSPKDMPQHYVHNMSYTKRVSPIFERCAARHILGR